MCHWAGHRGSPEESNTNTDRYLCINRLDESRKTAGEDLTADRILKSRASRLVATRYVFTARCSRFLGEVQPSFGPSEMKVWGGQMPSGKVKWFDAQKGFGFLAGDDGTDVFVHRDALPVGVGDLKGGQRVEYGVVAGRRGSQALQVRLLEPPPSVAKATRRPADEMTPIVEDLIKLLDSVSNSFRRGKYPDKAESKKVAHLLRAVADNLEP